MTITANTMLLSIVAAVNLATAIITYLLNKNMKRLETNTNSKMDQLLAVTGSAEHAKGKLEGRLEEQKEPVKTLVAEVITTEAIEVVKPTVEKKK